MKKLRILVLTHEDLVPPDVLPDYPENETPPWKTDFDVVHFLREQGHEVRVLGVVSDLGAIRDICEQFKPHVAFNLLEEFHGLSVFDTHVASYLELLKQAYTGCNPLGLMLARDKALSKKLLAYHRLPVPGFAVFPLGRKARRPKRLEFPLLVKSLTEDASLGIAQASLVHSDEKLVERVAFIHEHVGTDAIAEQYIEGREIYVGVLGNQQLQAFPPWELRFENLPEGAPRIATAKVKWDEEYQQKIGLKTGLAQDLDESAMQRIQQIARRVCRTLNLTGYARVDFRLAEDGRPYVIEANPNPDLGYGQEFAEAAYAAGIAYENLLQKIVNLGIAYRAKWSSEE